MNPVLILTRNNLELTKRCVESVQAQDVPTSLFIFDNGSSDGTSEWIVEQGFTGMLHPENAGVSAGWNTGISFLFEDGVTERVLVLNNDVELPSWFLGDLLSYDVPFVTGVAVDHRPTERPERMPLVPHPDFSAYLIKRAAWEIIGPFQEAMKLYASDCDYHVRGHQLGVGMWKANAPYFHINSATMRTASPEDRAAIQAQADADRRVFQEIYGCVPGTPAYDDLFK